MVRPYPTHTLEDALTVATAIQESNAGLPCDRGLLAKALGTTHASSGFIMKLNSSAKYGLTHGGYNDERISLTPRGQTIVAPKDVDELIKARIEAAMEPDVFGRFYQMLDGKRLPEDTYAQNMLVRDLAIHPDIASECLGIIKANGLHVGIISEVEGGLFVNLRGAQGARATPASAEREAAAHSQARSEERAAPSAEPSPAQVGRIFIGYSGNPETVQLVRSVLDDFGIPYGTAQAVAGGPRPVPAQVSEEMRGCAAGILVFGDASPGAASDGLASIEQMLYLIGAASALYGDKLVVLRQAGLELECRLESVPTVVFDGRNPEAAGLAVLRALHRAGVLKLGV
jgi:hypothetical protein